MNTFKNLRGGLLALAMGSCAVWAQEENPEPFQTEQREVNPMSIPELAIEKNDFKLKIGGAMRFHYRYRTWEERDVKHGGDFLVDMFRLQVEASWKGLFTKLQYRFFPSFNGGPMLAYGYMGYQTKDEKHRVELGLINLPLGVPDQQYHGWANTSDCFMGMQDISGMGIGYTLNLPAFQLDVQYLHNAGYRLYGNEYNRFSFNASGRNEEVHKGVARAMYKFGEGSSVGLTGVFGALQNFRYFKSVEELDVNGNNVLDANGDKQMMSVAVNSLIPSLDADYGSYDRERASTTYHYAGIAHLDYYAGNFNFRLQASYYDYKTNHKDIANDFIEFGAFGGAVGAANKGQVYMIAPAYKININKGVLDYINIFNDFSFFAKQNKFDSRSTIMNILGMEIKMGPVVIYPEWWLGKNSGWVGPNWDYGYYQGNGFEAGYDQDGKFVTSDDASQRKKWHSRFNINIGFYF
jgi:hypothetical protein